MAKAKPKALGLQKAKKVFADLMGTSPDFWESKGPFDITVWSLFIFDWGEIKVREIDLHNGKY